ncbi:MAG: hypothetical protein LBS19_08220, partial [Clostridiales bacterium]|nr:hypothetical protein [Clostridiales bacterium]
EGTGRATEGQSLSFLDRIRKLRKKNKRLKKKAKLLKKAVKSMEREHSEPAAGNNEAKASDNKEERPFLKRLGDALVKAIPAIATTIVGLAAKAFFGGFFTKKALA